MKHGQQGFTFLELVIVTTILALAINLLVDISYGLIDPRVRTS